MIETAQAFGVDIGGSGIKAAPVDLTKGDFAEPRLKILTPEVSTPQAVAKIVKQQLDHFEVPESAPGLAEVQFGAAKGQDGLVIATTLGTGIGTALIYNGVLIPNTELGHIILSAKHLDAEKYASSAIRENEELGYKKWAKRLTKYYGLMEKYFNPDLFTVGGGVSRQSEKFLPYVDIKTPIVPAKLRNQAGIVGAAYYASTKQQ